MDQVREKAFPLWIKVGLAGMILALFAGGVWFFRVQYKHQRQEVEAHLWSVAGLKAGQITDWRAERLADAAILMERHALIESVKRFLAGSNGHEASEIFRRFKTMQERNVYSDILLADLHKRVRLSLSKKTEFHEGFTAAFEIAIASGKPVWTPLHMETEHPHPHISVVTPLFNPQGDPTPIGAVILICDAARFLYPLIESWPTPSKTAESLLVQKNGDDVLFLNELRHQKDTALKLRIPLNRSDLPAAMAVKGKIGIVEGKDYRGIEVVAAVLPIPDSPWFMVSKMDMVEAFSDWRFRSALILLLMLGAVALAGTAGLVAWQRNLKAHYKSLYHSEAALRAAAEKQTVTLKAIGDAVIATDEKGRLELMNPIAETLTGWKEKEARGKALDVVFHIINEETRKPAEDPVARVLKEGIVVGLANHTLLIARDGKEIPIADSGAPVRDDQGKIIGVVLVFRDQSEERRSQRLMETRLKLIGYAAEHTLDELMTCALDEVSTIVKSPIGFYHFVEADHKTLSLQAWSTRTLKEFCRAKGKGMHYGIDRAGVWTDCVYQKKPVIHNDYASLPHKRGMPEGHTPVVRELVVPVIRKDSVVAVLGVGNKAADYTEKDSEIVSYVADVTWEIISHKRAEEALKESEARYRTLFDAAGVARQGVVVLQDQEGIDAAIIFSNEEVERLTGLPKHILEKTSWLDLLAPADQEEGRIRYRRRLAGEIIPKPVEISIVSKDGDEIPIEIYAALTLFEKKEALVGFFRDIRDRKIVEAEQKKLQDQLIQAQKMESVGRLAGGVAHDFNNMLGVILGRAELMLLELKPEDRFYTDLEEIEKAARRSADLTRQLLAFARKQTIAPKALDLNDTLEGMLKMLRRLIGENIDLLWKPDADLWMVKMDPAQIDQMLANLCVNARDAISGTGKVTIETKNVILDEAHCKDHVGLIPGQYVMLGVSDDGCGMDQETQSRLFEPFFTTKEVGKGTGLGLATVFGIVKQNNGFINVYSEPGQGTTFKIYIPRYEGEAGKEPDAKPNEYPRGEGETILLVEDDPGILAMGQAMLKQLGYNVVATDTGNEAVELVQETPDPIHLLITDVVMPQMSGKELAEKIKLLKPEIKVLFMSGYTANVIAHQGVLDEGVQFIEKPFFLGSIARKVREVMKS